MRPATSPIKPATITGLVNAIAWALERAQLIPDWAPYAVLAISVSTLLLILRPWIAELWPQGSQIHLRSPFFRASDTQRPVTTPEVLTILEDGWVFRRTNDGERVLVEHRGVYKIMEADAYAYFEKLQDNEKQRIIERWRRLRRVYWEFKDIFELVPVYIDPENREWRKSDIAALPDPAKARLRAERPDVWGFHLDDPDFRDKYPGRLPYDR